MSALPSPLLVQFLHVKSSPPEGRRPSRPAPVRMSCLFGLSPRPLTTAPFSVSELSFDSLLLSLCRSSTLEATCTPLALTHGPDPMRSRALTAGRPSAAAALRYARQLPGAPAAVASAVQCLSAPARPPRFAPSPEPTLVMKKLIFCWVLAPAASEKDTANTRTYEAIAARAIPHPPSIREVRLT